LLPIHTATQTRSEHGADSRTFHVLHYDVQIEPDLASRSVTGQVIVRFVTLAPVASVEFDCGDLVIDTVRIAGHNLAFRQQDHRLVASLRTPAKAHETQVIEVTYHGTPGRGFSFYTDEEQVYTAFSTSEWMVCIDAPDDKATIRLDVIVPSSWSVVGNGRTTTQRTLPNGRTLHQFSQDTPVSTYTFGFAAGRYRTVVEPSGGLELRYVTRGLPDADVRRIFATTADMLSFFAWRSGVPYPDSSYTQVLAAGTVQQEMSGFSMLNESYGAWVLDHPEDVFLGAHELAHQWWGNSVTCRDWNHFWLNEGMATYMAAAYIEHRFGRESYLRLIEEYRASYEQVRQAGHDKPLVFPDWSHPTSDDRTIVYRKGAYVLHLLRQQLGEDAFWTGIRSYTQMHVGESVTTGDLQTAMERAKGASLSEFFGRWVY
jgi:aminopeptidase N